MWISNLLHHNVKEMMGAEMNIVSYYDHLSAFKGWLQHGDWHVIIVCCKRVILYPADRIRGVYLQALYGCVW